MSSTTIAGRAPERRATKAPARLARRSTAARPAWSRVGRTRPRRDETRASWPVARNLAAALCASSLRMSPPRRRRLTAVPGIGTRSTGRLGSSRQIADASNVANGSSNEVRPCSFHAMITDRSTSSLRPAATTGTPRSVSTNQGAGRTRRAHSRHQRSAGRQQPGQSAPRNRSAPAAHSSRTHRGWPESVGPREPQPQPVRRRSPVHSLAAQTGRG